MSKASKPSSSTLSDAAFDSVLSANPGLRKRAIAHFLETDEAQAMTDGGRFMPFTKVMKLVDAAMNEEGSAAENVMKLCKEEKIPVSEMTLRRRFEANCVDRYHRSDPSSTHVVFHQMFRKKKDEAGLTWYRYLGTRSAILKCRAEVLALGVPEERARNIEDEYLKICFLHPSIAPEPPKMVPVDNEDEDDD